jgi:molybdopterin molybdotransferase
MRPSLLLVSAAEARQRLAALPMVMSRETVPLAQADGRILAESVVAQDPIPGAPRALMDGYAVRACDTVPGACPEGLVCMGRIDIGTLPTAMVGPGEALQIPTGGCLPSGADAVVAVEWTQRGKGERIIVTTPVNEGRNVAATGSDVAEGSVVVSAGTVLGPASLSMLAGVGCVDVPVFVQPRAMVFSSGNEVRPPGTSIGPAEVRDSNSTLLCALLRRVGCDAFSGGIIPDDPSVLSDRLGEALLEHDFVFVSAGTSIGGKDFAGDVVAELLRRHPGQGQLFHGIDIRPGKPTLVAHAMVNGHDRLIVGVPGFPTSTAVVFAMLLAPALHRIAGAAPVPVWKTRAILDEAYESAVGREDYLRVRFTDRVAEPHVILVRGGPAMISNTLWADGLVVVAPEVESVTEGSWVEVMPWG